MTEGCQAITYLDVCKLNFSGRRTIDSSSLGYLLCNDQYCHEDRLLEDEEPSPLYYVNTAIHNVIASLNGRCRLPVFPFHAISSLSPLHLQRYMRTVAGKILLVPTLRTDP